MIVVTKSCGHLLKKILQRQSGRKAGIGELGGAVVVVDEVDPARGSVAHLPARRQRAGQGKIPQISRYPRIIPGAHSANHVEEIHLTLLSFPHFVTFRKKIGRRPPSLLLLLLLLLPLVSN